MASVVCYRMLTCKRVCFILTSTVCMLLADAAAKYANQNDANCKGFFRRLVGCDGSRELYNANLSTEDTANCNGARRYSNPETNAYEMSCGFPRLIHSRDLTYASEVFSR